MVCSKCGAVLKDTAKFCSFCGAKTEEPPSPIVDKVNITPKENVYSQGAAQASSSASSTTLPAAEKVQPKPVHPEKAAAETSAAKITAAQIPAPEKLGAEIAANEKSTAEAASYAKSLSEAAAKPVEKMYAEQAKQFVYPADESAETEIPYGGKIEKPKRGGKKVGAVIAAVIAVAVIGAGAAAYPSYIKPYIEYSGAVKALSAGSYEEAAAELAALGDYKDSAEKAAEACLALADSRISDGDFDGALAALDTVPDSETAQELRKDALFGKADKLEQSGDHGAAAEIFAQLGDHNGASERYASALTAYADSLAQQGNYAEAVAAAENSAVLFDEEKLMGYRVGAAEAYAAEGDYGSAVSVLEPAADSFYNGTPVAMLITDYSYSGIIAEIESGNADEAAARQLAEIGSYKDSAARLSQLCVTVGEKYFNEGLYREAAAMFTNAGTFGGAQERLSASLYKLAEKYAADGDNASARSVYLSLGNYSDSRKKASEAASKLGNADHKNWYVSADTYAGTFCTAKFDSGETVTVSGMLMNSRPTAAPGVIVLAVMPDGTTSSVICQDIAADGKFTASFETTEDMSGTMEFRIMLTEKGVLLRAMTAEIG